jgi:hypothetical protein
MKNLKLALVLFWISTGVAHASFMGGRAFLGTGILNHNSGAQSTDATTTSKPLISELYPQLTLTGTFHLTGRWGFSPDFHYTPFGRKNSDTGESTSVFSFGLRALYYLSHVFDLHFGPGLFLYSISGSGGTIDLSNGASTTTFGKPSSSVTSSAICWDLGFGYSYQKYRLDFSTLITGIASTRRTISPVLSISREFL